MTIKDQTDAKKQPIDETQAMTLARSVDLVVAANRKTFVEINMKLNFSTSDQELKKLIVGPSGKLRAPTIQIAKILLVGFNESMYEKYLD